MFFKLKEIGKSISTDNLKKIQNIHDTAGSLGAGCNFGMGGIYESAKILEAALPFTTSHGDLHHTHLPKALKDHLGVKSVWDENGPWVNAVFPEHVVYDHKGSTFKQKYSLTQGAAGTDPAIKFHGDAKKVHVAYVDTKDGAQEAMRLLVPVSDDLTEDWDKYRESIKPAKTVIITPEGDVQMVREGVAITMIKTQEGIKALAKPIDVKIIAAGWGSSAYYPKEVLQRDGPQVFKAGTQMFWNHATESEEMDRPEGDLNDLAAVLVEAARWDESGAKGPGLYAKAKVFSDYSTQVAEKGPHIGVSINAGIKCHEGEAEGKHGRIADKFVHAFSADFVTKAGAGGAPVVPVLESDRGPQLGKENNMTDAEIKALNDRLTVLEATQVTLKGENETLKAANLKLQEGQNIILAVATVGTILKESEVEVSQKVLERMCANPVMKDGKPDSDWVKGIVTDLTEGASGHVTGLGHTREANRDKVDKATEDSLKESLTELGVSEAGLKFAMGGK